MSRAKPSLVANLSARRAASSPAARDNDTGFAEIEDAIAEAMAGDDIMAGVYPLIDGTLLPRGASWSGRR